MTIEETGTDLLQKLGSSYKPREISEEEDALGREDFLTMLVAQLKNQDPLSPMEGSDFSAQLAQFSSLEQLMNLNETMESMATAFTKGSEPDATDYIGKDVTANVDAMEVENSVATEGYYIISKLSEVKVSIYDSVGREIRTLYPGQKEEGGHYVTWDGRDDTGNYVEDGSYSFKVMADSGNGYSEVSTTVNGKVESVVYSDDGTPYLEVNGVIVSLDSIVQVKASSDTEDAADSAVDYLGKAITASEPFAHVDGDTVSGNTVVFELESAEEVVLNILNSVGDTVNSIYIPADDTHEGTNTYTWNGTDSSEDWVSDGLYSYSVDTSSGTANQSVTGEVSGIKYLDGIQYLVLNQGGALVGLSSITSVN